MRALTRRLSPDAPDECWHVYYGDVRVGTIALRTGIPHHEDPWGWACGFYPGSHPRECTDGTAATLIRTGRTITGDTGSWRGIDDASASMLCGLVLFGDKVGVSGTTPVCRR